MTRATIIILSVAVVGMAWLAWHNGEPMRCDEVIRYENGAVVCEVFIRESVNPVEVQRNGVRLEHRI